MAYGISFSTAKRTLRTLFPRAVLNWREARYFGRYGEAEMHLVDLLCRSGEDAIDVGANYGGYIHFMRRHARRVVAFEPVPEFVAVLRAKFGGKVLIEPIALSDRAGETTLYTPLIAGVKIGGGSSLSLVAMAAYETRDSFQVRTARLDDAFTGSVGFIKIDVEGHEHAVLKGAVDTIRRCKPRLLIEIEERCSPSGVVRISTFLRELGYRGYYAHLGELHGIEGFSVARLQAPDQMPEMAATLHDRPPLDNYVNNFIFLPPDEPEATVRRLRERLRALVHVPAGA
ncbi:FkbM family methyltransferase [Reyranella soli]|uniref:FkbM family methyltransferase n=1 Tax=Reyranella soli TaxID=1230389 RepID=UPI001479670A|nr:FkbM family methyltransferase [Reyranella soli]